MRKLLRPVVERTRPTYRTSTKQIAVLALTASTLAGCNVVPPLDCLMGASRDGCQRDANGE